MFIFPRVRFKESFMNGSPAGSIGHSTKSGWMNEEAFTIFLEHFIRHTNCSIDHPVLLILDNHESHISLKAVTTARGNGVVMLTLPPIATIGQNSLWTTEKLLLQSNGQLVKPYRFTRFQNLWSNHLCLQWPPQTSHQVSELHEDYAPSMVTDRPNPEEPSTSAAADPPGPSREEPNMPQQFQTQWSHRPLFSSIDESGSRPHVSFVSPKVILPLPKRHSKKAQKNEKESKNKNLDWHAWEDGAGKGTQRKTR